MLSISIVSHNHGGAVFDLLRDLDAVLVSQVVEVIVTLNCPDEKLPDGEFLNLRLITVQNLRPRGFGENHNHAFEVSSGDFFAVLNPDLRLKYGSPFLGLIAAMRRCEKMGMVAPLIVDCSGGIEDSVRPLLTLNSLLRRVWSRCGGPAEQCTDSEFFWIAGMFMVFRPEAFRAVRGFDERYFLYCEDFDICARMWLRGIDYQVVADTPVVHQAQRASRSNLRHFRLHFASLVKVYLSAAFWRVYFRLLSGSFRKNN